MANLYELTSEYAYLLRLLETECETEEERAELEDTLAHIANGIDHKAEGCARILRNMTASIDAIRTEEKRLATRRRAMENGVKRLKDAMMNAMCATGKRKIPTSIGNWRIQKNPPSMLITDQNMIPAEYWITPAPELDRQTLLANLKEGELIEGCELYQGESIRFT